MEGSEMIKELKDVEIRKSETLETKKERAKRRRGYWKAWRKNKDQEAEEQESKEEFQDEGASEQGEDERHHHHHQDPGKVIGIRDNTHQVLHQGLG